MATRAPSRNGVVVAAGRRLGALPLEVQSGGMRMRAKEWQKECWDYFDAIGEIKYGDSQLAEAAARVRIYVGYRPDPAAEPADALADGIRGAQEATDALDRLGQSDDGLPGLQKSYVINHQVAGEMFLVGEPMADGSEEWSIRSVEELSVEKERGGLAYKVRSDPRAEERTLAADAFVSRMWQPHPRFSAEADSPLRSVRSECDELLLLSRAIRGRARSMTNNGIVFMPNGLRVMPLDPQTDASDEAAPLSLATELGEALMDPILDESSPNSVVPVFVEGDGDKIDASKIFKLNLDRPFDATMAATRDQLLLRIFRGLNFPLETVQGSAHLNHWTAYVVKQSLFDQHVEPVLIGMCNALVASYVRPVIIDGGVDPADARNLILWYDASALIGQIDEIANVAAAHAAFVVSDDKYRQVINVGPDDAPDDAELERRIRIAQAIGGKGPLADVSGGVVSEVGPPTPEGPVVAAARPRRSSAGRRLADIDRALRARLEVAASAAMRRALDRAEGRLVSKARHDATTRDAIAAAARSTVAATLGPSIVAALGLAEPDLLDGAWDDFAESYDHWTARSQGRSVAVASDELGLSEEEAAAVAERMDADRNESRAWIVAALGALAAHRLYDPSPSAPPVGEHDPTLVVPPAVIREAMARAGGSGGLNTSEGPAGGIATGTTLRQLFADNGRPWTGYSWVYGDSERSYPPHQDLDGVEFATWTDEVLAGEDWLDGPYPGYMAPGDHAGCSCSFEPVVGDVGDENAGDTSAEAA